MRISVHSLLSKGRRVIVGLALLFVLVATAHAIEPAGTPVERPSVSTQALDRAIADVISRPEYTWRLPRERAEATETQTWDAFLADVREFMGNAVESLGRYLRRFVDWLESLFPEHERTTQESLDWLTPVQALLFVAMATAAATLAILLYRLWKRREKRTRSVAAGVVATVPETIGEDVVASQRPTDEWMKLAGQFMEKGEWRFAIRAMFLACLAHLADRGRLTIARHKSNREYLYELERKAHDRPGTLSAFAQNTRTLERVWYGDHAATEDTVKSFTDNQDVILRE